MTSLSHVLLSVTPWSVAYQDPPPWDFPGKSSGVGCHYPLQGIFLTQGGTRVSHIVGRCFTIWVTREVQVGKNLPANIGDMKDAGWSLVEEDPLEKEMATYSSILAWKIPREEEASEL